MQPRSAGRDKKLYLVSLYLPYSLITPQLLTQPFCLHIFSCSIPAYNFCRLHCTTAAGFSGPVLPCKHFTMPPSVCLKCHIDSTSLCTYTGSTYSLTREAIAWHVGLKYLWLWWNHYRAKQIFTQGWMTSAVLFHEMNPTCMFYCFILVDKVSRAMNCLCYIHILWCYSSVICENNWRDCLVCVCKQERVHLSSFSLWWVPCHTSGACYQGHSCR